MTLDNMTGITKVSYTGGDLFCKRQLITCTRVKECNGVCPFEDALKHADKTQTMDEQHTVDHDRDWIIGCIEHDGFIHTHRFDKANQIILEALQGWIPVSEKLPSMKQEVIYSLGEIVSTAYMTDVDFIGEKTELHWEDMESGAYIEPDAWMPLPKPYREDGE